MKAIWRRQAGFLALLAALLGAGALAALAVSAIRVLPAALAAPGPPGTPQAAQPAIPQKLEVSQGGYFYIILPGPPQQWPARFNGQAVPVYPAGKNSIIWLAASYELKPGPYLLEAGTDRPIRVQIQVKAHAFPVQALAVSAAQEQIVRPEDPAVAAREQQEARAVDDARSHSSPHPLWQGAFIWPVQGHISSEFGLIRKVNGRITGRHSGLDIAAPAGTPVLASNSGVVVLARNLLLTGNTVILDHGWGLTTSYLHMSQLQVHEGQQVRRGQVIGTVGATGFATGPHLHWTAHLSGGFIDPRILLNQGPPGVAP